MYLMDYPSSFACFVASICASKTEHRDTSLPRLVAAETTKPLSKAVSAMQHRQVPPNLHLSKLNPHIDVEVAWMKTGHSSYLIINSIDHMGIHVSHIKTTITSCTDNMSVVLRLFHFHPASWNDGISRVILQFHTAYHGMVYIMSSCVILVI